MLRKLTLVMLSFILLSVQVNAGTNNSLAQAIEELNYSLSVDWDQKDQRFYDQKMKTFAETVSKLQDSGLTNQQLVDQVISQIKDENLAKDARTTFNMIQINKMGSLEAQNAIHGLLGKSYNRGASWNGEAADVLITLAFLGVVALAIVYGLQVTCKSRCQKSCTILGTSCTENCGVQCD